LGPSSACNGSSQKGKTVNTNQQKKPTTITTTTIKILIGGGLQQEAAIDCSKKEGKDRKRKCSQIL
jgi:hypothetical protein